MKIDGILKKVLNQRYTIINVPMCTDIRDSRIQGAVNHVTTATSILHQSLSHF